MDALARKGQRTVFRLTLVRDWNMNEVPPRIHTVVLHLSFRLSPCCLSLLLPERPSSCRPRQVQGYADLIRRGLPDFVEIKGVTFTGGRRPELGMKNVPWHAEVVQFTQQICALVADEYEVRMKPLPPGAPSPPRSRSAQSWPLVLHG